MVPRKKHPNKSIDAAVQFALEQNWRLHHVGRSAHAWGRLLCPRTARDGCALSVWSTPKNAENHAKQIIRRINQCPH